MARYFYQNVLGERDTFVSNAALNYLGVEKGGELEFYFDVKILNFLLSS
jgi:hypothetical protein